jgi:uncharacterized protein (TIGR02246 family)
MAARSVAGDRLRPLITAIGLLPLIDLAQSEEPDPHLKDREAIIASVATYVDAYNAKDAEALAARWSNAGEWLNQETGERVSGRDTIREQFATIFADFDGSRIDVAVDSIRFITEKVAVEEGVATVVGTDGANESA